MSTRKNTQLKEVEPRAQTWEEAMIEAGRELAHITFHPQTPETITAALQALIVNTISNESGYAWINDIDALCFLLPRYLNHIPAQYARGIIHAALEMAYDACLP